MTDRPAPVAECHCPIRAKFRCQPHSHIRFTVALPWQCIAHLHEEQP